MFKDQEKQIDLSQSSSDLGDQVSQSSSVPSAPSVPQDEAVKTKHDAGGAALPEAEGSQTLPTAPKKRWFFQDRLFVTALVLAVMLSALGYWADSERWYHDHSAKHISPIDAALYPARLQLKAAKATLRGDQRKAEVALYDLSALRHFEGNDRDSRKFSVQAALARKTELTPDDGIYREACLVLLQGKRYEEAAKLMDQWRAGTNLHGQELSIRNTDFYCFAQLVYTRAGRSADAANAAALAEKCSRLPFYYHTDLSQPAATAPADTSAAFDYACKCLVSGHEDRAESIFRRLSADNKEEQFREYATLLLPVSLVAQQKWAEAEPLFPQALYLVRKAEAARSDDATYSVVCDAYSRYLAAHGRHTEARTYASKAAKIRDYSVAPKEIIAE